MAALAISKGRAQCAGFGAAARRGAPRWRVLLRAPAAIAACPPAARQVGWQPGSPADLWPAPALPRRNPRCLSLLSRLFRSTSRAGGAAGVRKVAAGRLLACGAEPGRCRGTRRRTGQAGGGTPVGKAPLFQRAPSVGFRRVACASPEAVRPSAPRLPGFPVRLAQGGDGGRPAPAAHVGDRQSVAGRRDFPARPPLHQAGVAPWDRAAGGATRRPTGSGGALRPASAPAVAACLAPTDRCGRIWGGARGGDRTGSRQVEGGKVTGRGHPCVGPGRAPFGPAAALLQQGARAAAAVCRAHATEPPAPRMAARRHRRPLRPALRRLSAGALPARTPGSCRREGRRCS